MNRFDYILERINKSKFNQSPYQYILIDNFFNQDDFESIVQASEINTCNYQDDNDLIDSLERNGFEIIYFPGTTQNKKKYINWHKEKNISSASSNTCEGFGITFRLSNPKSTIISELNDFLMSKSFIDALLSKFNISGVDIEYDAGIQKYLDGYEISPHPDIRRKLLTFMVNINPSNSSESNNHHTHIQSFKKKYSFISDFWRDNRHIERAWVPWEWSNTEFIHNQNNSLIVFAPDNKTLHAVKADYDHLKYQRTQLYGNIWRKSKKKLKAMNWEKFDKDKIHRPNFLKRLFS